MESICTTKTIQTILNMVTDKEMLLFHKLQRPEGQWGKKQKSDLIDSLLRDYPVNPLYGIKENDTISIIDGIQRISTLRDYISDEFALDKNCEPVNIRGDIKELAKKKYSQLDEVTKRKLIGAELQLYELRDCTEKDIREIFRRQNAGKPLNSKHMRVVYESDELNNAIFELINHPFIEKITTPKMNTNGSDRDAIIQTLMLMTSDEEYTSFRTNDINSFVKEHSAEALAHVNDLTDTLDKLENAYSSLTQFILPVTSIPMILFSAYTVIKEKKSFKDFTGVLNTFEATYKENDEYKQFTAAGTGSTPNVKGRLNWWKDKINGLA